MAGNLAPLPIFQFVDQNGHPLSGGSLEWFAAGTQNRVSIFADNTLTVPLPNPVPLDTAGRPRMGSGPTPIWFDGNRAYKAIHRDAEGRILWTADNIVSPGTGAPGPPGPPGAILNVPYATGTWQPTIVSLVTGHPGAGTTYATQWGWWTKIGNLVFVTGRLILSHLGTSNNELLAVGGLPFPVSDDHADGLDAGAVTFTFYRYLSDDGQNWVTLYGTAESEPSCLAFMGHFPPFRLLEWLGEGGFTDQLDLAFTGFYRTPAGPGETSGIGSEQVILGEGETSITLAANHIVHIVRCDNVNPLFLTQAMSSPPPQLGERLIVMAQGPGVVYLMPDDANPTPTEGGFVNEVLSAATPLLRGIAEYVFTPSYGNRWRLLSHRQYLPIPSQFEPSDYATRQPGNTWTVTAGNVLRQHYELVGGKIRLWIELAETTFTGSGGDLIIRPGVWGHYTPRVPTQNAGLVIMIDGDVNDWEQATSVIGWAQVKWDENALMISNLTGVFHGPHLNINATLEFEVT